MTTISRFRYTAALATALLAACAEDQGKLYEYFVEVDSPQEVLVSMSSVSGTSQQAAQIAPGRPFSHNVRARPGEPLSLVAQIHGANGCVLVAIRRDQSPIASQRSCGDYVVATAAGIAR